MSELEQLQTESLGWIPLEDGYLHLSENQDVIEVVGIANPDMANSTVIWMSSFAWKARNFVIPLYQLEID